MHIVRENIKDLVSTTNYIQILLHAWKLTLLSIPARRLQNPVIVFQILYSEVIVNLTITNSNFLLAQHKNHQPLANGPVLASIPALESVGNTYT